ncbi:gliding motility-associated C-terminal domain-containing protein [Flavobacteriaceae bacterium TK19130]|nr:gliding motility-associated C-terminal domain-containing protein [Thermobacterium salinum]
MDIIKEMRMQKAYLGFTVIMLIGIASLNAQNLDFENGNYDFWDLTTGQNHQTSWVTPNKANCPIKETWLNRFCVKTGITGATSGYNTANYHDLISPGMDPLIGQALPTVIEGNLSLRLGSFSIPLKISRISHKVLMQNANPTIKFNYALVMKDPEHHRCCNPYFQIRILKLNGNVIYDEAIVADNNDPYFKKANGYIYKDWDCKEIGLKNKYAGEELRIEFTTADCSEGAADHFTYAYIDAINDPILEPKFSLDKEVFCFGDAIIADATLTNGEIDHFWSIEESDESGKRYPSTEVSKWFTASQANIMNLTQLYRSLGGTFKCNTYYRIKLAVGNNCIPWRETTKLIRISCPKANAGRDICCSDGSPKILGGSLPNPNYTYEWFPKYGLSNPYSSITNLDCTNKDILEQGDCFEYTLRVTDQFGCQAEDNVRVFFEPPKFNIMQEKTCCGIKLYIQDDGCYSTISWSTGDNNTRELFIDKAGTYSVNLSNSCGDARKSITVTNVDLIDAFKKRYPKFIAGAAFTPNNDGVNDELQLFHFASDAPLKGDPIAYNATDYELYVTDRNGTVHLVSSGTTCTGFYNGEIKWDGKINGQLVQDGVYTYFLKVKNCDYPWVEAEIVTGVEFECIDCGFTFIGDRHCPGVFNGCKAFGEKEISSTRPRVTVFR